MVFSLRPLLNVLEKIKPYAWPKGRLDIKARIIGAIFFLISSKLVLIGVPFFFKWATEALVEQSTAKNEILYLSIGMIMLISAYGLMRVLNLALNHLRDSLFSKVGQGATCDLYRLVVAHVYKLSQRFHVDYKIGKLSSAIINGTKAIEIIIRIMVVYLIPTIIEFIITIAFLWNIYGYAYVTVILLTLVMYTWFTIVASNWRVNLFKKMNRVAHDCHAKIFDSLVNFESMKYFNSEKIEFKKFEKSISQYEKSATSIAISLGWLNFGQGIIFSIGMVVLMLMSAHTVYIGQQTIGDFVFINALLSQLSIPLNIIGTIYRDSRQSLIEIEELFNILDEKIDIEDMPNAQPLKIKNGSITFDNVYFSYNSDRPILQGTCFDIPSGKKTALIGKSGVGKSTISKLLYRLYDINSGSICIDGQNIKTVTQESLRQNIGIIPQDTILFNDTLRNNILYGHPDCSDDELRSAVKIAQLETFIMNLPNGYDTLVGERGLKLSGGEKQRISIARAVLKDSPIMVFDEATSSLDTLTERSIQESLDSLSKNRTILVIAHRLSTVINADVIIVLRHNGKIAESGSHEELISRKGVYFSMWEKQQESLDQ
ncbi:MAG: ABC transporter ATP-binding protein/permease [Candidatus Liberibacter ctenarytainae]|uniref:ABC transporter ATP-binding protein/permease n=1 Tax=Candidatus Liberibacter ctenarytainae TaxID=2020335 RepID=A0A937AEF7_9HYPH|nr:ABC transporter ATP-binding protein/permease [Candidatus Liberibacter ctenarytainae]